MPIRKGSRTVSFGDHEVELDYCWRPGRPATRTDPEERAEVWINEAWISDGEGVKVCLDLDKLPEGLLWAWEEDIAEYLAEAGELR